jgi:hypothetical protein
VGKRGFEWFGVGAIGKRGCGGLEGGEARGWVEPSVPPCVAKLKLGVARVGFGCAFMVMRSEADRGRAEWDHEWWELKYPCWLRDHRRRPG